MKGYFSAFAFVILAPLATATIEDDRLAIYGNATHPTTLAESFNLQTYDENIQVAKVETSYDQNQNDLGRDSRTIGSGSTNTLSSVGNSWSAYLLPQPIDIHKDSVLRFSFTLEEDTVDGFQAICLDEDTNTEDSSSSNGKCFVLRSTQGWITDMINVLTQTDVGETSMHSIPIGDFFTGPVNYVAFIQDSDGPDRSVGRSSLSDIQLLSVENEALLIEIDGTDQYLANDQASYMNNGNDNEDTKDYWMTPSEDRKSVQIGGNQWKALPLNEGGYNVTHSTVLEFDLVVEQGVDYHAICLDVDLSATSGDECVVLQNPVNDAAKFHHLTTKIATGVSTKLVIPFGTFMNLKEGEYTTVHWLGFIQDNDVAGEGHLGRTTWSNFRLYDEDRMDFKLVGLGGEDVTVANIQAPLESNAGDGDEQDSREHLMSVSTDGLSITTSGNSWKYLTLPSPMEVTAATMLQFDFAVTEESEMHIICLLNEIYVNDGRKDCFSTAGLQDPSATMIKKIEPYTTVGETRTYDINIGNYFTGSVAYLGFILDNDLGFTDGDIERTYGQSSWSNIRIYNLPSLNVGLDDGTIAIENNQISYESAAQDNTPIGDYRAVISEDGSSFNMVGNMWRALELPSRLSPTSLGDFVVSFDFAVDVAGEIHAICFEENLHYGDADNPSNLEPRRCLSPALFQERANVEQVILTDYQVREGESHRYVLNLSKLYDRLQLDPVGDGTITPGPSSSPTPAAKTLDNVGNNGSPAALFPLGQCQGDCDSDAECQEGLTCTQRNGGDAVLGCLGFDGGGTDYCTKRPHEAYLWHMGNNGVPASAFPLQMCDGDCDGDGDCAGELQCFQRNGLETVPGCEGAGKTGTDYCYDPYPKQPDIRYLAFLNDNDADKSVGDTTFSNIAITTSLSSCLSNEDFSFQLNDCTAANFLDKVKALMEAKDTCVSSDPLLELFSIFDATQEMDVYKKIEKICTSSYKLDQYDFADNTLGMDEETERQIVKEFIDGGTVWNYEDEATSIANIAKMHSKFSTSRFLSYPKHHALDKCDIGAAMCCFVASRTSPQPAEKNSDVCYVDMKASRRTAHVADGYSIYGDSNDNVYCEGFAWGQDGGSMSTALRGNALFQVGFMDNLVTNGSVEQVPGAPLCGCVDRMPVVTEAACTSVTAPTAVVDVSFNSTGGVFDASFTMGDIEYGNCGDMNLVEYYESLVDEGKASAVDAAYLNEKIVGDGNCGVAISDFLTGKGLVMG